MKKVYKDHLGQEYSSIRKMCDAYGINISTFDSRMRRGMSLQDALTKGICKNERNSKACKDHLGNCYSSTTSMCKAYGIDVSAYRSRIRNGWNKEDALTKGVDKTKDNTPIKCEDHLGNKYKSISKMCEAYGIDRGVYMRRIKEGMSIEDALTKNIIHHRYGFKNKVCMDHLGNEYRSISEMCSFYRISEDAYYSMLIHGYSIGEALELAANNIEMGRLKCTDHLGKEYRSANEMCRSYGISLSTYRRRMKDGWTQEEALTKGSLSGSWNKKECTDHLGNKYSSIDEMCIRYNTYGNVLRNRLKKGDSLKDALTKEVSARKAVASEDHLGNKYKSIMEMCRAYGINRCTYMARIKNGWSVGDALTVPALHVNGSN